MKRHAHDEGNDDTLSFTQDQSWKDQLPKQEEPVAPGPDIPITLSPEDMRSALPTGMAWAWVDGRFAHSRYLPDAVKNAAELSGSDEMETNRLATLVGRNIAPKDRDIAFGIIHQGQPVIWHSTVDRNVLMDGLVPYLNEAARQALEDRKRGEDDVLDEFDLRPSFDVAAPNSEHGAYNKMRDERVGSTKQSALARGQRVLDRDGREGRVTDGPFDSRLGTQWEVDFGPGRDGLFFESELHVDHDAPPYRADDWAKVEDTPEQRETMVTHASWRRQSDMKRYPEVGKTEGDGCSVAEDEDGVYVKTHRSRSKSYPTYEDIPKGEVDRVATTASLHAVDNGWRRQSGVQDIKGTPLPEILNISLGDETEWFEVQPMKNPWEVESPDEPFQNPWDEPEEEEAPEEDPDAVPDFVPEEWPEEAPEDPHENPDEDEEWHEEEVEEDEKERERELVPAGRRRASLTRWFRMGAVPQGEAPVDVEELPMFTEHAAFRVLNVGPDLNLWSGSSGGNHTKWLPKTWMVAQCARGNKHREIASPDLDGKCPCGIYCVDPEQMDVMRPYAEAHPYVIVQLALRGAVRRGNAGAMIAQSAAIANITVPKVMKYFGKESSEQVAEHLRKEYGVPVKVGTTPFKMSSLPEGLTPDVPKLVTDVKTALEILDFRDLVKDTHDERFKYVLLDFQWADSDDEDRRRLNDARAVVAKEAGASIEREFIRDGSKSTYTLQDPPVPALVVLDGGSPVVVAQYDQRDGEVVRIRTRKAVGDPAVIKEFATALGGELDESAQWWEHYFNDGEVDEIDNDFYIVSDSVVSEDEIAEWLEDQGKSYTDNYRWRGISVDGEHISDEPGQIDFIADEDGNLKAVVVRDQDGHGYADENVLGVWGDSNWIRRYVEIESESVGHLQWSTKANEGYADNHGHYGYIDDGDNYVDGEHFTIYDLDDLERFELNNVGWEDEIVDDYYGNDKGYDDDTDENGILVWKYEITRRLADTIDFTPDAWVQCASEMGEDFVSDPENFASIHGKTLKELTDLPVEMKQAHNYGSFYNDDWDARYYQQDDLVEHVAEHLKSVRPRSEWDHVDEMGQAIDENGGLPNRPLTADDVAVGDRIEHIYSGDTGTVTRAGTIDGWYKSDADGQEKRFNGYKSLRKLDGPQVRWPESGTQQMAFDTDDYWQSGAGLSPEAEQFIQLLRDSIAQSEGQKSTRVYNDPQQRLTSWKMAGHFTVGPDGRPRYIPSGEELRADGRKYDEPLAGFEHDLEWLRDDVPEDIQWHLEHEAPKRQG